MTPSNIAIISLKGRARLEYFSPMGYNQGERTNR
jgi:hypothetical protein